MMTRQKKSCRPNNLCLSRETDFSRNKISSSSLSIPGIIIPPYRNIYSAHLFKLALLCKNCAYRPFRHVTFWQESFRHKCFIMGTFWHMHHSALRAFRQMDISTREIFGTGNFWCRNISAQGYFGT